MRTLHRNVFDIMRGSSAFLLSGVVSSVAPFVVSLLVSRYLGKEALGLFSVCFAIVLAGVLISDLGLNSFLLREFAGSQNPSTTSLRTLLLVRTGAAFLVGMLLVAITFLFIPSPNPTVLSAAAFALVMLRSVAGALENVVKARLYRTTYVLMIIGSSIAHLVLVFAVLSNGLGIVYVFMMMSVVEMAKAFFLAWVLRGDLSSARSPLRLTIKHLGVVLTQGLPFAFIGLFTLVIEKAGLFLLAAIQGNAEAGVFSAADRFLVIGVLLDSALFASALPVLSLLPSRSHLNHITKQTLAIVISLATLGTVGLFAGAPILIGLTFRFPDSVDLLRILSLSLPAILLNSVLRITLFSVHQERDVAIAFGTSCFVNIALNVALIPHYGATGAAIAAVVTEYATSIMYGLLYSRNVTSHLEIEVTKLK